MRIIPSAGSPSANSSNRIVSGPPSWRTTQAFTGGRLAETGPPRQVVQQRPDEDQGDGCPVDLRERSPLGRPDVDEGDRAAKPQQREVDEKARVTDFPKRDGGGVAVLDELSRVAPVLFGGQRRDGFGGDGLALLLLTRDALDLGGVDPGGHLGSGRGDGRRRRRWGRSRWWRRRHGRHRGALSGEWLPPVAVEAPLPVLRHRLIPPGAIPEPVAIGGPPRLVGADAHRIGHVTTSRCAFAAESLNSYLRRRSSAWLEQRSFKPMVPGSNPGAGTCWPFFSDSPD